MGKKSGFFDFAAEVGLTKHFGGAGTSEELAGLCHIGSASYVLDVGCGVGVTPCSLVKSLGCRVVGVDISEKMVDRASERARAMGVQERTEFRVADAADLPFADDVFDALISESVTVFPRNKARVLAGYARVVKPGGYVGLAEATWLQTPPPEMTAWASQDLGADVEPQSAEGWVSLLEGAGLREVSAQVRRVQIKDEGKEMMRRYGCLGMMGILARMLALYLRSPDYREFVGKTRQSGLTPKNLTDYFGYGLYVGRKAAG